MKISNVITILIFFLFLPLNYLQASGPCDYYFGYEVKENSVIYYEGCIYCTKNFHKELIVKQADPETFQTIRYPETKMYHFRDKNECQIEYGKDKNFVFYKEKKIKGLSPESFVLDRNFDVNDFILESVPFYKNVILVIFVLSTIGLIIFFYFYLRNRKKRKM